jgi:cysteinyl-tRNA synthetase
MTIRFFILQAHYRSTLDFSNEALQAAQKGFERLMKASDTMSKIKPAQNSSVDIKTIENNCYQAMNDDFNSPIVIANLFDAVKIINSLADGNDSIDSENLDRLKNLFNVFVFDILGLIHENAENTNNEILNNVVDLLLNERLNAKQAKDWSTSDRIRDELIKLGFEIKDKKDGFEWELK